MAKYSITAVMGVVTDKMKAGLSSATSKLKKFGAGFKSAMAHPAVQAAGQAAKAIVDFGVDAVKTAGKIDASMNEVFTLLPGIAEGAKKKMTKQMMELSSEMGKMPEDMMGSLYNALSAGVPKENVFDFLKTASKAAIGGVATTEQAVGALTTVMNGYKMPATEAANVSDTLFTVIKNGVTTMPELAANIGKVTPIAASLGIKFEEVGAAFAEMTKNLGPGKSAETGTMLKTMFAELGKASSDSFFHFKEATGKTFPDFIAAGGSLADGLKAMEGQAKKLNVRLPDLFNSVEAGNAALILSADGAKGLREQMEQMGKKSGAAGEAFKTVDQGFSRMMEKLMAGFESFKYTVGKALAPVVKVIMPLFLKGLKMIQKLPWDKLGQTMGKIQKQFEPIMELIFELVQELFPLIGPLLELALVGTMATLPVLAILLKLLIALMPVIVWLVEKIAIVAGWFNSLMGWITKLIAGIGKGKDETEAIVDEVADGAESVKDTVGGAWEFIKKVFKAFFKIREDIIKWLLDVLAPVGEFLKMVWTLVSWPFKQIHKAIKAVRGFLIDQLLQMWENIKATVNKVLDIRQMLIDKLYETFPWLEDLIEGIKAFIMAKIQGIWDGITNFFSDLWMSIKQMFSDLREQVMSAEGEVADALRYFWILAEEIGTAFIDLFKKAGSVIKAIGGAVGWVAKKLGLASEEASNMNEEVKAMSESMEGAKGATAEAAKESKSLFSWFGKAKKEAEGVEKTTGGLSGFMEKIAAAREKAADAEERTGQAAEKTAEQMERQTLSAEQLAFQQRAAVGEINARVLGEKKSTKLGAEIIKASGVNVKLLQATVGKHKEVNSMAKLYTIIASGKKTPAQLIQEANQQQWQLNTKAKKFTIKSPKGKTPVQQIEAATTEQTKLNAEAAKNPLLQLGQKGMEVKSTVMVDAKFANAILKSLGGIHSDTSGIYKQLKGKFVNQ